METPAQVKNASTVRSEQACGRIPPLCYDSATLTCNRTHDLGGCPGSSSNRRILRAGAHALPEVEDRHEHNARQRAELLADVFIPGAIEPEQILLEDLLREGILGNRLRVGAGVIRLPMASTTPTPIMTVVGCTAPCRRPLSDVSHRRVRTDTAARPAGASPRQ